MLYRDAHMTGWAYKEIQEDDLKFPVVYGEGKRSRLLATIGVTRGFGDHDLNQTNCRPTNESGKKMEGNELGSNSPDANRTNITEAVLDLSRQMQLLNKRFAALEQSCQKKNLSKN